MRQRLTLLLGVFAVMALSNAVVPVLPALAEGAAFQGAIFSAYFLGAFLTVFPAGLLSDRIGRVFLVRAALLLTIASGALILMVSDPLALLAARALEGIGAGLFVPAAMSWINLQSDHRKMSGNFIAALNVGLVVGLVVAGWLNGFFGSSGGIMAFTVITLIPLLLSLMMKDVAVGPVPGGGADLLAIGRDYFWMYVATIMLIGATGAVTALYPEYTGEEAAALGVQLGAMNVATIFSSLAASRVSLKPIPTIRASAALMGAAVALLYFTPVAFVLIGALAGVVIIAQVNYLAADPTHQGAVMGLFNTATYAGMTLLPFAAGVVAEYQDFAAAFAMIAVLAVIMAATIGRCRCKVPE
ncbi:MFS transporter [Methanofollis aquaemaris]|uniref:MFS transporter n=1 Tax=Methanofollis aquaemaris TaxID=126734 RepID=A0A8A3S4I5_9EURY|nr:MFS transporter [Methanofollis aquaemaris]QSZ66524.1 MFS transporter [Methanofollis aquaemaris]